MAELVPIRLGQQAGEGRSGAVSSESLINLYIEKNPEGAKGPLSLIGTPGLKQFLNVGTGPIRGLKRLGPDMYIVSGDRLYVSNKSGITVDLGEIKNAGNVHMATNGLYGPGIPFVLIATTVNAYAASRQEGVIELPEGDFNGVGFQDGYGLLSKRNSEDWFVTALDDMTSIGALDFAQADAFGDQIISLISDHREVWVLGAESIEVFHNAGLPPPGSPFARSGSGFMERGCLAEGSVAKAENQVFWLGDDKRVYTAASYRPVPISTHAIEKQIKEISSPQSAWAFAYSDEGHTFYVLTFPEKTFVFDQATTKWHTRKSDGLGRWRANQHVWIWGKNYVGDFETGQVYELDLDTYDEAGRTLRREATAPPIHQAGNSFLVDEYFIDVEAGVGLTEPVQGSMPELMLDWSDDGGKTYGSELRASAGEIGEYGRRARWQNLGSSRQRTFRMAMTDPVKAVWIQAYAQIEVLGD